MRKLPSIAAALCALSLGLPAHAQEDRMTLQNGIEVRPDDSAKLGMLDADMGQALRQAFAAGAPEDVASLTRALSGAPRSPEAGLAALKGNWKCQTMKLGDTTPLTVYGNFNCSFDGKTFQKTSGSQRTTGEIHIDAGRLIYLGTGYVEGSKVPAYADLPADPLNAGGAGQIWSDVAVVEVVSPNRARMIFADPALESLINVIYLTR